MDQLLTYEQLTVIAKICVDFGVEKIRITGGEPLMRKELYKFIKMLSLIEGIKDIALTTNAYLLSEQVGLLKNAGLKRVTVSLDALAPEVAAAMSGNRCDLTRVLKGIEDAGNAGFSIKINTVIKNGENDGEILPLVGYARENGHIIRFIEFMDVGNINSWNMEYVLPSSDLVTTINRVYPCEAVTPQYRGEVASRYRFLDGKGEFGVISSVTQPFCRDCTRARLSAKGVLYTCLFASEGHSLKGFFYGSDPELKIKEEIKRIWSARLDRYSELRSEKSAIEKVEMYEMGG